MGAPEKPLPAPSRRLQHPPQAPRRRAIKPRHGFGRSVTAVPPASTFGLGQRSRGLPAACAVSFAHGSVGYVKPGLLAMLDCTPPGRGTLLGTLLGTFSKNPNHKQKGFPACDWKPLVLLVGAAGFELATPCTPCKCATRLRYAPTSLRL